jgi:hypothetical protein
MKDTQYVIDLERQLAGVRRELEQVRRRYQWAANELLACDYGDNDGGVGIVGWLVYGWRDRKPKPHHEHRRIFGRSIDEAIDAELP